MNRLKGDLYWSDAYKGLIFKIVSLVLTFFNVSLMVNYLGESLYGSWITVSSIVTWMNAGDFGIGNGLRNEVSKSYASNNQEGILSAIYSTNKSFLFISGGMFVIIMLVGKALALCGIIDGGYVLPLLIMAFFPSIFTAHNNH